MDKEEVSVVNSKDEDLCASNCKSVPDVSVREDLGGSDLSALSEYKETQSFEDYIDITPEKNSGVLKRILKEGIEDDYPGYGDKVSIHYTGFLLNKAATVFDTNRKEEKFEFNLGRGMVIKGWDLGIGTMKKGEIALFVVHPNYAYGKMGYPPVIPPYASLAFEIELYEWWLEDLSSKKNNSILRKVLQKGEGNIFPNEGSTVKVKLGKYIDELLEEEEKEFVLGEGCCCGIPEDIETALLKFRLNEKSMIILKNKDVHVCGNSKNTELKYEVTLLDFKRVKDIWDMNTDEKYEKAQLAKEKGTTYFNEGNYKTALKQFKWIVTCLENEPGVPLESEASRKSLLLSGYLNIALCHLKLENYNEAINACDKALVIDDKNEKALFRRAKAKMGINNCEDALQDFETLCSINSENKAAKNFVLICKNNIKKQNLKDKETYNKMFEIFIKQDEDRLKNMKTETGVWENNNEETEENLTEAEKIMKDNSAILDANVIEISNTANINFVQ